MNKKKPQTANRNKAARATYEAAKPSKQRKFYRDQSAPNVLVSQGAVALRNQARHLQRNHDIVRGIIRTMVNNIVGPNGIGIEPQPRTANGDIHEAYATALREAWRDWCIKPEVTHTHTWAGAQRLLAGTWLRDGEAFAQHLLGLIPALDHGTRVPYSLELIEPDMIPMDYSDGDKIRQGIERNVWGRKIRYYVYRAHPGELTGLTTLQDLKYIPAERMLHLAIFDRIGQLRGVSEFASVIGRLEDVKDYEESERVAAKIAARLTAYVKKGSPDLFDPAAMQRDAAGNFMPREIPFEPGMVVDSLGMGEEIGLIDSKRPNPNAVTWRQGQLRAVAAGVGASYSSIARDYNGTYSAQRQELVEQWVNYAVLADEFVGDAVAPVWRNFVSAAHLSGVVPMPKDVDQNTVDDCLYISQSMPWINPMDEAQAWEMLVRSGFAAEVEVMRRRGANPRDVLDQMISYRKKTDEAGLVLSSNAANDKPIPQPAVDPTLNND